LPWTQRLPEGDAKRQALEQVREPWVEADPGKARRSMAVELASWEQRPDRGREQMGQNDPQAALNGPALVPQGNARDQALASAAGSWAENSPRGCRRTTSPAWRPERGRPSPTVRRTCSKRLPLSHRLPGNRCVQASAALKSVCARRTPGRVR